ncbi:MAG: NACHT domain-containing protein [Cuspidothrix sp.]
MTGFEHLPPPLVTAVAAPIVKTVWDIITRWGENLTQEAQNAIPEACGQYEKRYRERHGILKVLGMREPVKLESVYTAVQFLNDDAIRSFASIEELEELYREAKRRKLKSENCEKQPGIKVANEKQYLMVLGRPGAGKSTFIRKMGLEALNNAKKEFTHDCIPVFIELKRFESSEIHIEKYIIQEFDICGFPYPEKFTAKALEQGKLLILLDGLDEVPTQNLTQVINQIQNFVDKHDQNRFIASCRTAAYRHNFRRFSDVAMADFDDEQIQQFITNWFHGENDTQAQTGAKCWELLQKPENEGAKELAHTPLLLTFLCLVYDRSQNFPNNRSVLYKKALRILLEEWAAEKRILRDEIYQGLHTELEELLLAEIAYTGFKSNHLFFSEAEIVEQIKTFLASNLNAPQHLDGEAVLNAIAIQQGILVERAEDVFSFSHLTLQEYLTAQYIYDHQLVEKLVTEHLTDKRWKEVFLLVAGIMQGGADNLLLLMEKEAQKYISSPKWKILFEDLTWKNLFTLFKTPKLQALLNWAEKVTVGSEGNYKPVGKRAVAIAYAIANANANAIANANANAIAIANANAITESIKYIEEVGKLKIYNQNLNLSALITELTTIKATIPNSNQPEKLHQDFAKKLIRTLLKGFNLTPEMMDLSKQEIEALDNYLYANYLIIQCKDAAVRVSPTTWEAIEDRMLLGNK